MSHGRTTGVQNRHYDRWHYLDEKRAALAVWEHHLRAVLAGHTEATGKVVKLLPAKRTLNRTSSPTGRASPGLWPGTSFYAGGATLMEVRVTHPLAVVEAVEDSLAGEGSRA